MATDTTALSYWINWRFFLCALWLLASMVVSAFIIWKYEGPKKPKSDIGESSRETKGLLYKNEVWRTSLKVVHPGWLLAYRVFVFCGALIVVYYEYCAQRRWTFTLITIYFGVCYGMLHPSDILILRLYSPYTVVVKVAKKTGILMSPQMLNEALTWPLRSRGIPRWKMFPKIFNTNDEDLDTKIANTCEYCFQIIYQICAGSVMLTDCVFWFVIYPFMTSANYRLGFIDICFHSINAVLLLGDVFLNCMSFPFFRIAYFILWTSIYVTFQWIIHAYVSLRWPYPFLDLSSLYAPIWYLAVGLLHLPCYGVFALINKLKHCSLSRLFPEAFQSRI